MVNRPVEIVNKKIDKATFIEALHSKGVFRKNSHFGKDGVPAVDAFYFRVSGLNIYYTETDKDPVVLGAIAIKNVQRVAKTGLLGDKCFKVENEEKDHWELCVMDEVENCNAWTCNIMHSLGGPPCPKEGAEAAAEGGDEKKEEAADEKKEEAAEKKEIIQ